MELIKGAPVSAKIKEEVGTMLEKINGPAPKLAIVRVGENPDDMSYERGAVKKMDGSILNRMRRFRKRDNSSCSSRYNCSSKRRIHCSREYSS